MQRLLSLFLALLTLVGSIGVTVNRHFCMGELKSVALFAEAEVCHRAAAPACPLHAAAAVTSPDDCCNDEHELVQLDDDRQLIDGYDLPADVIPLRPTEPLVCRATLHLRSRKVNSFAHYRPPPLWVDAGRQYQLFRL